MGVFLALCAVCACALMLLLIGRGFTGQCLDISAWDLATAICGRVRDAVVTFEPAKRLWGRGRRSKVRPCQLMRHCTPVRLRGPYGWTDVDDGLKRMWLR